MPETQYSLADLHDLRDVLVDKVEELDVDTEFGYPLSSSTWRRGAIDIAAPEVVDPHWPGVLGLGVREPLHI